MAEVLRELGFDQGRPGPKPSRQDHGAEHVADPRRAGGLRQPDEPVKR
jgi:hypothetical protein